MSLKHTFAKALMQVGLYPAVLVREQLFAAIQSDDPAAVQAIFVKTPSAAAYRIPVKEGARPVPAFEAAVVQKSFKAAAAMVQIIPDALTRDYSAGEDFINRSLLMQCAITGDSDEVAFLIREGANVTAADNSGDTALHFAAGMGKLDAVGILATAGADITAPNKEGVTPLMEATKRDTSQMVEKFIAMGAAIDTCDENGLNATMHAIRNQNIEAATLLMQKGGVITNFSDPAIEKLERVATYEMQSEFLKLMAAQYERERWRTEAIAAQNLKQICETGTTGDIKIRPIRLKGRTQ